MKIVQAPNSVLSTPVAFMDINNLVHIRQTLDILLKGWQELKAPNKAGLAATQIGLAEHMAMVGNTPMMNMTFESYGKNKSEDTEGCYSINNAKTFFKVSRHEQGLASWIDPRTGERFAKILHGFKARVFQHELDHLNGRLCNGK